jgi:putative signal transducing protein
VAGRRQSDGSIKEVFVSVDPTRVKIASDLLESIGIETFVFDGAASRMLGGTAAIQARLMVHAEDAGEALERLRELGFAD